MTSTLLTAVPNGQKDCWRSVVLIREPNSINGHIYIPDIYKALVHSTWKIIKTPTYRFFLYFGTMAKIRKGSDLPKKKVGVTAHPTKIFALQVNAKVISSISCWIFDLVRPLEYMAWHTRATLSALHHCLLVFLFLADQIFYGSYVNRQNFPVRSFASLSSALYKEAQNHLFKVFFSLTPGKGDKNAPIILRTEHAQGLAVAGKLRLDLAVQPCSQDLSVTAPSALSPEWESLGTRLLVVYVEPTNYGRTKTTPKLVKAKAKKNQRKR